MWLPYFLGHCLLAALTGSGAAVVAMPLDPAGGGARIYDLFVTWGDYAQDGHAREMFLINGQSPGPTLEFDQDDHAVVRVHNLSPYNTTLHMHGIEMHNAPWSDGVPGVTQRPIQPGQTFIHEFDVTQHGSYWYHSHFRSQIEDGMYGPILIHPRPGDPKPFHLIPGGEDDGVARAMEEAERSVKQLIISDLSHFTSEERIEGTEAALVETSCYDSIVFNGKGSVNCLDPDVVEAHLGPVQRADLALVPGSKMTDKACLPVEVMDAFGGGKGHPERMTPGIFEGCHPTEGSVETITVDDCDGGGSWVAIDIIGAVNFVNLVVSIDEHDMWVYALDGSYIKPQKVQALIVENGTRFAVLVRAHKVGDFKIRANANSAPQMIIGHAVLSVKGGGPEAAAPDGESAPYIDIAGNPLSDDVAVFSVDAAAPYPDDPVPPSADATHVLHMRLAGASYEWAMNTTKFLLTSISTRPELPRLFRPEPHPRGNVTLSTANGTWVDLVLLADTFPMPGHPVHKHGNKMYKIGAGDGPFRWSSVDDAVRERPELFNLVDPPRADGFSSPRAVDDYAWTVVRYQVVSPGPWLIHCHIQNHMAGGMMVVIQDGVDAWPEIPEYYVDMAATS